MCLLAAAAGCGAKPTVPEHQNPPDKDQSVPVKDKDANSNVAHAPTAEADSLETLLKGLPDNARPTAINDSLAFERANAWIKANVLGKRVAVPHPLEPLVFDKEGAYYTVRVGDPYGVISTVPVTLFGVTYRAKVYSDDNALKYPFTFRFVDDALADKLKALKGKTGAFSGRLDDCRFQVPTQDNASIYGASLWVQVSALRLGERSLNRSPLLRDVAPGKGNPFGVATEAVPDDADSRAFADRANLHGGPADDNAQPWAKSGKTPTPGQLDGEWEGRWWCGLGYWVPNTDRCASRPWARRSTSSGKRRKALNCSWQFGTAIA
jgi:hypothetical protein